MTVPADPSPARCPTCESDQRRGYQRGCHGPLSCDPWHTPTKSADPSPAERREWAEDLLSGTTPGPWAAETEGIYNTTRSYLVAYTGDSDQDRIDAPLIAAAPDLAAAVRDLADELAAARAENAALRAERDSLAIRLEETTLRYIEASNPGIDIDLVRRDRAALSNPQPQTVAEDQQ